MQPLTTLGVGHTPYSPSTCGVFSTLPGYDISWQGTGSRDINQCSRLHHFSVLTKYYHYWRINKGEEHWTFVMGGYWTYTSWPNVGHGSGGGTENSVGVFVSSHLWKPSIIYGSRLSKVP